MELKLQQFYGPIDLLLNLIEEQKLPITELSILIKVGIQKS